MNKQSIYLWAQRHMFGLFLFNSIIMLLVLLHNAGYFHPFFIISINFIVVVSLVLAIILLNATSKAIFLIAISFWLLTAFFKITTIDTWAERSSIYAFNAFAVGVFMMLLELVFKKINSLMSNLKK
jgi:hypothetical protein